MKSKFKMLPVFSAIILIAIVASACGQAATPTPVPPTALPPTAPPPPTEVPTQAPTVSADPTWDRVQSTGRLVFGTSADYAPYESYDNNFQLTGFDIALARELGSRLGLQVEFKDIAFDGLPIALQISQIDAAIAAISVTPSRQAIMDFTNVYYTGQDMILARQNSGIGKITVPAQLGQHRVGVERGSAYEAWIKTTLIDTALMPAGNLFIYEKPEHAVRDLRENRIELVIMDLLAAEEYLLEGGLESVGKGLNTMLLAVALPKGAGTLQARLNDALLQTQNDGTLSRLINQYLNIDTSNVLPIVTPTPAPTAVVPTPTVAPAVCYDAAEFVADMTIPDGTVLNPRQDFDKIWRLKNSGTCTWDSSYRIVFVQGDLMDGASQNVRGTVRPGEFYDMTIDQRAPSYPGNFGGVWQMVNGKGTPFGTRVWVKIRVPGNEPPPTAIPQPTAVPPKPVQPTLAPSPVTINFLNASATSVNAGDLVTISWSFVGQNLAAARLTRTNPDGTQTALYGGADVMMDGQYDDLMMMTGTYTYSLNVSAEFGGTAVKTVTVTVN